MKNLRSLCEALAGDAVKGLSWRVATVLDQIHMSDKLRFQSAKIEPRKGLVVRGEMSPELRIDAAVVANTSWVRAFLWAFLFSLREEAIEQLRDDPFPLLVVDDPQATFDAQHRHMWAQYVISLQGGPSRVQLLLTTHDENFRDLINADGVCGRKALIAASGACGANVQIFEGGILDRKWAEADSANTREAGRSYLQSVRIFTEGMLKQILRGQDADIRHLTVGALRDRLRKYSKAKRAPWDQPSFDNLVRCLDGGRHEVKYIEGAHHSTGRDYGMSEAASVEKFWRKTLHPALQRAYRTLREHRLVHSGLSALDGPQPAISLPNGYKDMIRAVPLRVFGRAAALSDGLVADGNIQMNEIVDREENDVHLSNHSAYRLAASTLEPVAKVGDLILTKEDLEPSPKSLVVAISGVKTLARRFEVAANHTDVAVLTAQSVNPRQIAQPVIASKSTFELRKIVGVLYDDSRWSPASESTGEVCECGGEAVLRRVFTAALGLVEVSGHSAEPHALDGQFLIVRDRVANQVAIRSLDGRPVIAQDSDHNTYFKRLRWVKDDSIVLESLDGNGTYDPIVLAPPNASEACLEHVWPVIGVLFEI